MWERRGGKGEERGEEGVSGEERGKGGRKEERKEEERKEEEGERTGRKRERGQKEKGKRKNKEKRKGKGRREVGWESTGGGTNMPTWSESMMKLGFRVWGSGIHGLRALRLLGFLCFFIG